MLDVTACDLQMHLVQIYQGHLVVRGCMHTLCMSTYRNVKHTPTLFIGLIVIALQTSNYRPLVTANKKYNIFNSPNSKVRGVAIETSRKCADFQKIPQTIVVFSWVAPPSDVVRPVPEKKATDCARVNNKASHCRKATK